MLIKKSNHYVSDIVHTEQWSEGFALCMALAQIYEEEEMEKVTISAQLLHHSSANPVFRYGH